MKLALVLIPLIISCAFDSEERVLKNKELIEQVVINNIEKFEKLSLKEDSYFEVIHIDEAVRLMNEGEFTPIEEDLRTFVIGEKIDTTVELKNLSTQSVESLAEFGGKITIVNFWASVCVSCLARIDTLNNLLKNYGSRIELVNIAIFENNIERAEEIIKVNELNFPNYIDIDGVYGNFLPYHTIPLTLVLDKNQIIQSIFREYHGVDELIDFKMKIDILF